jgi:hyperosmotically inducible periplasmic protein
MLKFRWFSTALLLVSAMLLATTVPAQDRPADRGRGRMEENLRREVNHELVMLPWLSVFDNLQYKVNGTEVTLMGQVTQPVTKSDAENHVKSIEGVTKVNNEIEVLPLSPNDDRIRRAVFRAVFADPGLEKYSMGSLAPLHIIVKNGHVTLEGVVLSDGDKNRAGIRANGVSGVFSVTNNLRIENSKTPGRDTKG